jgi:cytoskeletal protein CcmA (bactofilin family)
MAQLIDLGKIRFHWAGTYSAGTTYELNDVVKYEGNVYVYINNAAGSGNSPTNTNYWALMVSGIKFEGAYDNGTAYQVGDGVSYNGVLYVALQNTTGNLPTNTTYWSRFNSGFRWRGSWSASTAYLQDDLVFNGLSTYIATDSFTSAGLFEDDTDWDLFALGASNLPNQAGNSGKVLTTDGTTASWTTSPTLNSLVVQDSFEVLGDSVQRGNINISSRTVVVTNKVKDNNVGTITTTSAHFFDPGDVVVLSSVGDGFNGSHTITAVPSSTTFEFIATGGNVVSTPVAGGTATVYGNIVASNNVSVGGDLAVTGDVEVDGPVVFDGHLTVNNEIQLNGDIFVDVDATIKGDLSVTSLTRSIINKALSASVATLTTSVSHGYDAGDTVTVSTVGAPFDGEYTIASVPSATTFTYVRNASNVTSAPASGTAVVKGDASFGNDVSVTRNIVIDGTAHVGGELSSDGVPYFGQDAKTISESIGQRTATITNKELTDSVATLTTSSAHGFSPFQYVIVDGVDAVFDGEFEIIDVPTPTTLTYSVSAANVSSTAASGTVSSIPGFTNPIAYFSTDSDDYSQVIVQNHSSNANASSDFIAYPDNGEDFSGFIDMGITSSTFADPEFTITGPNDGYIFMTAPIGTSGDGNLVLATGDTGNANKIIFAAGGLSSNNTQMEITPDQNIHIEIATESTSPTTGALTVVGGVGVQGDMNIQGDVSIEGTITFGGSGTTVETANLAVTDPVIFVGTNNQNDIVDLGLITEYTIDIADITRTVTNKALNNNTATLTTSANHTFEVGDVVVVTGVDATFNGTFNITGVPTPTTFTYVKTATNVGSTASGGEAVATRRRRFAGVARDASDGVFKAFQGATAKPTTTVDFAQAGLEFADFNAKNLDLTGNMSASGNAAITGNTSVDGTLTVTGTSTFNGPITTSQNVTISGRLDVQEIREDVLDATITSNILTADYSAGNIFYVATAPTANFTVNLTNAPTDNGKTISVTVVVVQGATGYIPSAFQIAGAAQTLRWSSSLTPTPTSSAGKLDIFNFTLIRRASAWVVLGSAVTNF